MQRTSTAACLKAFVAARALEAISDRVRVVEMSLRRGNHHLVLPKRADALVAAE